MKEISEYKGNKVLKVWNEAYPDTFLMMGKTKWSLVLDNITDIEEFVDG